MSESIRGFARVCAPAAACADLMDELSRETGLAWTRRRERDRPERWPPGWLLWSLEDLPGGGFLANVECRGPAGRLVVEDFYLTAHSYEIPIWDCLSGRWESFCELYAEGDPLFRTYLDESWGMAAYFRADRILLTGAEGGADIVQAFLDGAGFDEVESRFAGRAFLPELRDGEAPDLSTAFLLLRERPGSDPSPG